MTPQQYQLDAARTLIDAPPRPLTSQEHMIVWNAVGLAGEAGEVLAEAPKNSLDAQQLTSAALAVCEHVKKGIFHEQGLKPSVIAYNLQFMLDCAAGLCEFIDYLHASRRIINKELGDLLWYTAALCTKLDIRLDTLMSQEVAATLAPIMAANITKLQARFPAGWSTADAAARADEVTV